MTSWQVSAFHDDVINWKHFPRYWPFVWGIHCSPANSPHKGQCCGALMFSMTCAWTISWSNNGDAGDLRRHHAHYNVILMPYHCPFVRRTSGQPGLDECLHWWCRPNTIYTLYNIIRMKIDIIELTHWPLGNLNDIKYMLFSNRF